MRNPRSGEDRIPGANNCRQKVTARSAALPLMPCCERHRALPLSAFGSCSHAVNEHRVSFVAQLLDESHGVGQHEIQVGIGVWVSDVDQADVDLLDAHRQVIVIHAAQGNNSVHTWWEGMQRCDIAQPHSFIMWMLDRGHPEEVIAKRFVLLHDSSCQCHRSRVRIPGQPCSTRRHSAGTADAP
jgi:hypothetical protein